MLCYFEKFQELICTHSKEFYPHMTVFHHLIVLEYSNGGEVAQNERARRAPFSPVHMHSFSGA